MSNLENLESKVNLCKERLDQLKKQKKDLLSVLENLKNTIRDQRNPNWRERYDYIKSIQERSGATASKPMVHPKWYDDEQLELKNKTEQNIHRIDFEYNKLKDNLSVLKKELEYELRAKRDITSENSRHKAAIRFAKDFDVASILEDDLGIDDDIF